MPVQLSMNLLDDLVDNEEKRLEAFPICRNRIFMSHAAVTALPRAVADAVIRFTEESSANLLNFAEVLKSLLEERASAPRLIGSSPDKVQQRCPPYLGLRLFSI